ncbi:alpha/beta hydrolase [Brevibacterium sp. UCMA 11754]|uniref:alpha/beta hydrolase n=1 Tax=Brevibacterium sp. UCMA 11754 TaxID=2749198 RepID=UPI001F3C4FE1|nr:alpha/beta hydrolase [Brevibacterium sp. UCMA 11754]MCF2571147.1 alpha/beta hydrolase [Brevibacterium sp. UCMA 11754]
MSGHDQIAEDAWPLIKAFRENGSKSFEKQGLEQARLGYEQSCALNGPRRLPMAQVSDLHAAEQVPVRHYVPESSADDGRIVLYLHGGGWVFGSLDTHDGVCRSLASNARTDVIAVDYRLAPEHPYPAALEDARTVLEWLASYSNTLGVTPSSIAVVGDSAGGGLAAVLAQEYAGHLPVAVQVLFYPVTDLTMSTESYKRVTAGLPVVSSTMEWFANQYAGEADRGDPALSPLHGEVANQIPASFVCTVGQDPLCDEGIAYAGKLARAGSRVEHVHLPEHAHGLFTSAGAIETGQRILDRASRFLDEVFEASISNRD